MLGILPSEYLRTPFQTVSKGNSAKFTCRIVHRKPHDNYEDGFWDATRHASGNYVLWWCIKIRGAHSDENLALMVEVLALDRQPLAV